MYNRYIGNTGKFYRVEDADAIPAVPPSSEPDGGTVLRSMEEVRAWEAAQSRNPAPTPEPRPEPAHYPPPEPPPPVPPPPSPEEGASKFDLGKMFQWPGSLRQTVRDLLPAGLDLGDILLILVLFYLFLEGEDDDMLIILGILMFMWIRPLFQKEEDG